MSTAVMNNAPTVAGTTAGIRRVKAAEPLEWLSAGVRSFASAQRRACSTAFCSPLQRPGPST